MSKLKKMMSKIERAMTAITFAESGEFDTAREIINRNRKVLLGITNADVKALCYAVNICNRVDADLDILFVYGTDRVVPETDVLNFIKSELKSEDINYTITQKIGSLKQELIDYTINRREIIFVVVGSSSEIDVEFNKFENRLSSSWEELKCPLVVVTNSRMPVAV